MEFKDRIKLLRNERNLSLTDLGATFGKSESACRAWELGRTKPDADTIIKLCAYFDCTADYLLGIVDARNPENTIVSSDLGLSDESIAFIRELQGNVDYSVPVEYSDGMNLLDIFNIIVPTVSFKFFLLGIQIAANGAYLNMLYEEAVLEGEDKWRWGIPLNKESWERIHRDAIDQYVDALISHVRIETTLRKEG